MLKPGDRAPSFDLPCAAGGRIARLSLAKFSTELALIFFYPRDFSFICPTEVTGFNRALKDFTDEATTVVGASIDDAESHLKWARELGGIEFPLLADTDGKLAKAFGIFDEKEQVALRATFILDQKRKVVFSASCPLNVGRSVVETLRIVRALRTGQLCPADWKPGVELIPSDTKF
ncbi:MAG: redoxin domain-containing protein [Candidatus Binatus sp.]|uniref:redoxin domain-containing protein n=1 Tax=Candidatus Binatus sp. TaxID=2811406 RepID=UPI002723F4A3|nr:redoxin domain-containing protein [Candidatus Binatus sp.]MDO8434933.1 redoxin domain-containing protein [Candidatus Binatus sp.]